MYKRRREGRYIKEEYRILGDFGVCPPHGTVPGNTLHHAATHDAVLDNNTVFPIRCLFFIHVKISFYLSQVSVHLYAGHLT